MMITELEERAPPPVLHGFKPQPSLRDLTLNLHSVPVQLLRKGDKEGPTTQYS